MRVTLHVLAGPQTGRDFTFDEHDTLLIGGSEDAQFCLPHDRYFSRHHCLIEVAPPRAFLRDLGSTNGTYVNDQRVVMPVFLTDGARIRIADNEIVFSEHDDEPGSDYNAMTLVCSVDNSGVEARAVALLVCDILGFSTMSENVPAEEMAQTLGAWFRETGNIVAQSVGTIDKFIGDAVLAYWGTAGRASADCDTAFSAAKSMLARADSRQWPNGDPFRIAVALHYGRVICCNVGTAAERDATIVGDAVNTVFRLEALSKELDQRLVMSGEFAENLPDIKKFKDFGDRALLNELVLGSLRRRGWLDHVIGGPGAFIVPADSYENFAQAVVRKLILEIAANDH